VRIELLASGVGVVNTEIFKAVPGIELVDRAQRRGLQSTISAPLPAFTRELQRNGFKPARKPGSMRWSPSIIPIIASSALTSATCVPHRNSFLKSSAKTPWPPRTATGAQAAAEPTRSVSECHDLIAKHSPMHRGAQRDTSKHARRSAATGCRRSHRALSAPTRMPWPKAR